MRVVLLLGVLFLSFSPVARKAAAQDPLPEEKKKKIEDLKSKIAEKRAELAALEKELFALKLRTVPVQKGTSFDEAGMRIAIVKFESKMGKNIALQLEITNLSDKEDLAPAVYLPRLRSFLATDDTGRKYSDAAITISPGLIPPKGKTFFEKAFLGMPLEGAKEIYFDLPESGPLPPTRLVVKAEDILKKK